MNFLFMFYSHFLYAKEGNQNYKVCKKNLSSIYTETIKLCPLDVYVCQFLMYERISNNFITLQTVII